MANINIDANSWAPFALRWIFAGFWGFFGWALGAFVFANIPWPN